MLTNMSHCVLSLTSFVLGSASNFPNLMIAFGTELNSLIKMTVWLDPFYSYALTKIRFQMLIPVYMLLLVV